MKKKLISMLLVVVLTLGLTACGGGKPDVAGDGEPDTAGDGSGEKIVVTALYPTMLPEFEALVESTFDDIDLQIEQSTTGAYNSDILRRLRNGHGKDLIFTTMPNGEISDYVMDLSANAFTTRFTSSVMSVIEQDGMTAWLPMPSVYKGLIINKTLTEELGKELPTSQQELMELMAAAKAAGVGVDEEGFTFAVANIDGVSVGEFIISTMVPDFLGTMEGERWTNAFVDKTANAEGTLEEYLSFMMSLAEEGYMDPTRNHPGITWRNAVPLDERMAERKMTAGYAYSDMLHELQDADTEDEFVMIPFLSAQGGAPWVTTTPSAYLGANAALSEDEEKLDAVLRILELFATTEGQAAIIKDTRSDSSYLTEPVEGSGNTFSGLEQYVEAGYVYNIDRFNSDVLWALGSNIIKACAGRMELSDALAAVDDLNQNGAAGYADDFTLIGSVEQDLLYEGYNTRLEETALGNLITDAIAELAGVDIAFANGGGTRASLYAGDVYTSDLAEVCPYSSTIVVLDVTGETLYQMLENSIQGIYYQDIPAGRFLQVSGLRYTFSVDPATEDAENKRPAEATLLEVTLADGSPIDRAATYRIAVNNYMCGDSGYIDAGDGYTMLNVFDDLTPKAAGAQLVEDTGKTYADAIVSYFQNHQSENISPTLEGRITVQKVGQ